MGKHGEGRLSSQTTRAARMALVILALCALVGCRADAPSEASPALAVRSEVEVQTRSAAADVQAEFQADPRVKLTIVMPPSMRIGQAGRFLVRAEAMRDAENYLVNSEVIGDPASESLRGTIHLSRQQSRLTVRRGGRSDVHTLQHTFTNPGLYLIRSCVMPTSRVAPEQGITNYACRQVWVLAEESGMRMLDSWDAAVLDGARGTRYALYGSFGPFVSVRAPGTLQEIPPSQARVLGRKAISLSVVPSSTTYTGRFTFGSLNPLDENLRVPIGSGVAVSVSCVYPQFGMPQVFTDADGEFSIPKSGCDYGVSVTANLVDQYSTVTGPNSAAVASSCYISSAGYVADCRYGNSYAAGAFARIRRAGPLAVSRFGRSRSVVSVWANDNPLDNTLPTLYRPAQNRIEINASRSDGDDGDFVAVHEYGHAFQYGAIETPASYSCINGEHQAGVANTRNCAFVEGFADFFGAWLTEGLVTPLWGYSAADFEFNQYRFTGNGTLDEGAVAGLMLDLVDDPADNDGISGDDDTMTYPATFVEQAIRSCNINFVFSKLDGADQFVYCVERSVNSAISYVPTTYQSSWRVFPGNLTAPAAPAGYSLSKVRAAWQWNFFNAGGLQ